MKTQKNSELKKVIDADNQKLLEYFDEKDTAKTMNKYAGIGKWDDISLDCDGDIILWEQ